MIFYEVEHTDGHYLVATQADAKREAREKRCTWSQVDIPTDKQGLMGYINDLRRDLASVQPSSQILADEGNDDHVPVLPAERPSAGPSYVDASLRIEDQFQLLPLALQLHLAAFAIERAREAESVNRTADAMEREPSADELLG